MQLFESLVITRRCRCCGLVDPGPDRCPRCRATGSYLSWYWRRRWYRISLGRAWRDERDGLAIDRSTGRWCRRRRLKDKQADRYEELVTDLETGVVVYEHRCRLSEHVQHSRRCRAA